MFAKAHAIAAERGGRCLSEKYVNTDTKMEWECAKGHRWEAKLNHVKDSGSWCKQCAHRNPGLLVKAQEFAAGRNGQCLSPEFSTTKDKLRWKCARGHEWDSTYRNTVYLGRWCPHCAGRPVDGLALAKEVATERGGECLSTSYKNCKTDMRWRCAVGHEWDANMNNVRNGGRWCPACCGHYDHLPEMNEFAQARGGLCLAEVYPGAKTPVLWECQEGHRWMAASDGVLNRGSWCPRCRWTTEEAVRQLFERLTGQTFLKTREALPVSRLELDGFCEEIRVAFEYQGIQHYRYVPHFHRGGPTDLVAQKARDQCKAEECVDEWIALVVVPYDHPDLEGFIEKELRLLGVLT